MLFDERTIQYFQAITNEQNISRAAQKLYISQPSLSRFLSKLEKQLGGELFHRHTKPMTLTPLGECFLRYTQEAQQLDSRYRQMFSELLHSDDQELKIGAGTTTSPYLTRGVFLKFQQEYPHIRLQLVEDIHVNLLQKLDQKQIDLALLVYNGNDCLDSGKEYIDVILSQPRLLVTGRQHPLAALVSSAEENSIFSPQPILPEMLENQTIITGIPGQKIWEDIQQLQRKYAIKNVSFLSSQSVDSSISIAACGTCFFSVPLFYLANSQVVQHSDLVYFTLNDPLLQWTLAVRYSEKPSAPELRIAELVRETFRMDANPSIPK